MIDPMGLHCCIYSCYLGYFLIHHNLHPFVHRWFLYLHLYLYYFHHPLLKFLLFLKISIGFIFVKSSSNFQWYLPYRSLINLDHLVVCQLDHIHLGSFSSSNLLETFHQLSKYNILTFTNMYCSSNIHPEILAYIQK